MNASPVVGVGAVIVQEDKILLIKRGKAPYVGSWTLPGGTVGLNEPLERALIREVHEETGLDIIVGRLAGHFESIGVPVETDHHFVILDFFAAVTGGTMQSGDDAEEVEWVELAAIEDRTLTPKLVESLKRFGAL